MSKKVDKRIQQEYDRIAAGPHTGWFTCLHHAGDFLETSHNVIERLDFILSDKPKKERLTRLINIVHVSDKMHDDYDAKVNPLYADYDAKRKSLYADYEAKIKPLYDDYEAKRKPLYADYLAKVNPLHDDYLAKVNPLYDDYDEKRALTHLPQYDSL
jgi:hypothetical protein